MTELAKEVRRRREALDLTQGELAEFAGCSRTTIKNIEAGRGEPIERTVNAIVKALDERECAPSSPVVPSNHGLYYVTRDGSQILCLTADKGPPEPPTVERVVLVALLRYVLGEYGIASQ